MAMSAPCCGHDDPAGDLAAYRKVLRIALVVNALMFVVEVAGSRIAGSASLLADSIDFFGDAGNYAISLAVLARTLPTRSWAALLKAATMGVFGVFVLVETGWSAARGLRPEPYAMGAIAVVAFAANLAVAGLLFRFRGGDANRRSVWVCTRNDVAGNVAVGLAALGVFGTGRVWPDLTVALVLAGFALAGATAVFRQARNELRVSHS